MKPLNQPELAKFVPVHHERKTLLHSQTVNSQKAKDLSHLYNRSKNPTTQLVYQYPSLNPKPPNPQP